VRRLEGIASGGAQDLPRLCSQSASQGRCECRRLIVPLIPARGGYRRLPGKNTRRFHGKPLIAALIAQALESRRVDRVVVSTEDPAIAEVSRSLGADILERPTELGGDVGATADTSARRTQANQIVREPVSSGSLHHAPGARCQFEPLPVTSCSQQRRVSAQHQLAPPFHASLPPPGTRLHRWTRRG
jgi:hypothetical protein